MKRIFWLPLSIIAFIVTLFAAAGSPPLLGVVRTVLENTLRNYLGLSIRIKELRGNIFYALEFKDIEVGDGGHINRIKTSYDITRLLSKEISLNLILIEDMYVDLNRLKAIVQDLHLQKIAFNIRIKELSITNSSIMLQLNERRITAGMEMYGSLDNNLFTVRELKISTEKSHIAFQGQMPIEENAEIDLRCLVDVSVDELGINGLTGRLSGNGHVRGSVPAPEIVATLDFHFRHQENELIGATEFDWQMPLLEHLNLKTRADARIPSFFKNTAQKDEWQIVLNLENRAVMCTLLSSYGDAKLIGILGGTIEDPELTTTLTGKFIYDNRQANIGGHLTYRNEKLDLVDFRIVDDKISVNANAMINIVDGSIIKSDISAKTSDLSIINVFLRRPQPIAGELQLSASAQGRLSSPNVSGFIKITDAQFYGEEVESAYLFARLGHQVVSLDSAQIISPRGVIDMSGKYNFKDHSLTTHVFSEEIILKSPEVFDNVTIPISGKVALDINLKGTIHDPVGDGVIMLHDFVYDTLLFDNYQAEFKIKNRQIDLTMSNDKHSINLNAAAALFNPHRFHTELVLNHFDLTNYVAADSGYLTAQVLLQGNLDQINRVNGNLKVDTLYLRTDKKSIQNVGEVLAKIDNKLINIQSCLFDINGQQMYLQGWLPMDFQKGDINLTVRSSRLDLSNINILLPNEPQLDGILSIDLAIKGKIRQPDINGQVSLEHLKYSTHILALDSTYCRINFRNNHINIDYLKGKVNQGNLSLTGFINMSNGAIDTMSLDLSLDKVTLKQKDYGSGMLTSKALISAKAGSYLIAGEVKIDKWVYDVPFNLQAMVRLLTAANRPPPQQDKILKQIYCNVGISAPNGIKIANNLANAEVDLDLQLKGYLSRLNVSGTIATSQMGTIQYLGKRFEIAQAVMEFDNPYKIDPVLDLEASYFVSSSDGEYEIIMHLSGTIEDWRLELTSNPPLPEYDIVSLLLIGERRPSTQILSNFAGVEIENTAKDYALSLMRGTIERKAEQTLGLEKFTITGDLSDPGQLDIGIEKRIARRFTLVYGTGIESWEMRRIGLNYDVTDNFSVYTLHDQENMNSSIDLDFHFKLK